MSLHPYARAALAACCLAGLGAPAGAATLGLSILPTPVINAATSAFNDPLFFLFYAEGSGVLTVSGVDTPVDFTLTAEIGSDGTPVSGAFSALDGALGSVLESTSLTAVGFVDNGTADVIELLFDAPTGSAAASFGTQVLARLFGDFGSDPFGTGFGDFLTPVASALAVNPIGAVPPPAVPLPAAGLLLLTGLGALAGLRRRA